MKIIAFFNNKGGVGKTSLVYHLAWMYAELDLRVVAADLDPQANLSAMFLEEDRLEQLWPDTAHPETILGVIQPILKGTGDIADPHLEAVAERIGLLVGDLGLSSFEDKLSDAWPRCHDGDESAFRIMSAFYRALLKAAEKHDADLLLVDAGPNLGAINRAVMVAATNVVVPLAPDLFSLQGLRNLGPTLRRWRKEWSERLKKKKPDADLPLPGPEMRPAGYVIMQHAVRLDRPVKAYEKWIGRIPVEYRKSVMAKDANRGIIKKSKPGDPTARIRSDPYCLALLKHYRSLMPLAQEARKPMFFLRPADGAIGSHVSAVTECYEDFKALARKIAEHCGVALPS